MIGSALMRCLRIADGLNTITRRGEIGTSVPVFGLRPILWPLLRTTNEPKEDNFTVSPRSRQSVISWRTSSTRVAELRAGQSHFLIDRFAQVSARHRFSWHRPARLRRSRYLSELSNDIRLERHGQRVQGRPGEPNVRAATRSAVASPSHENRAPGKPAAHCFHHDQIAAFDAALRDSGGQRKRD